MPRNGIRSLLGFVPENLLPIQYELSKTFFTIGVLFPIVNMTVLFGIRAVTGGAMFFHG